MASFNKVIIMGNISTDVELKQTTSGTSVCSFNVAVNRKTSDGQPTADFFSVSAWRQTAEFAARNFRKGDPILVCGKLQTRSWTDNAGNKRISTEIVADDVSFCAGSAQEAVGSPQSEERASGSINSRPKQEIATQAKFPPSVYMPDCYKSAPQMDDVPNDGDLPF